MSHPRESAEGRPLIAHVVYRFDVGGLENGVVNLINRLSGGFADHCVVALTTASPRFVTRILAPSVRIIELHKAPGPTLALAPALYRLFRSLRPAIVHTRNVGTLEAQLPAWAARVPVRIHGEHGWDVGDLAGENSRMLQLRRVMRYFVQRQIALSEPTHRYLSERVGVPEAQITNICNGVDTRAFVPGDSPGLARAAIVAGDPGAREVLRPEAFVVGAMGRLAEVKNLPLLVDAFAALRARNPEFARRARLAIVGDGPQGQPLARHVDVHGLSSCTWMPGARRDVVQCLQAIDLLCLPSLAEGISNAILEAMACGVPVIATDVGGNRELVADGLTGQLVPSRDTARLAGAIEHYFTHHDECRRAGVAARDRAVTQFSLEAMVCKYHRIYGDELARAGWPRPAPLDLAHPANS